MVARRIILWLIAGASLGFGILGILSIGLPFVVLGVVLGVVLLGFSLGRYGLKTAWAFLIGLGVLPAAILLYDVSRAPWACDVPGAGVESSQPGVRYYTCVDTPVGTLTAYHVMAAVFGAIALLGVLTALVAWLVRRGRQPTPLGA